MDPIEFFRKVTNLEPTPDQANLLRDLVNQDEKYILIMAGRQVGILEQFIL
jgi:hypothetical protein